MPPEQPEGGKDRSTAATRSSIDPDRARRLTTQESGGVPGKPGPEEDWVPSRLGAYEVLGAIGRGAMGVVYEATDGDSHARVAIKALEGVSPEALYRFKREFRSLAEVRHENVVSLYDLAVDGERMFFTMELVRGRDFVTALCGPTLGKSRIKHAPCTDYRRVREAMRQLAAGVSAIHRAGFLHRDIKPSNVLVDDAGRVVLLDFGLVRDIDSSEHVGVTADGAVLGTPLYMSPEQASGQDVGTSSDWYSVGEMLFQVLTGVPPYAGLGMLALLAAKRDDRPVAPSSLCAGIPRDLDELCSALLARIPADRPGVDAVLEALGAPVPEASPEDSGQFPFLGRDRELEQLEAAAAQTAQGRPVVAFVEGTSGIGKTALVHRFLARHANEVAGTLILSGRCSERESIPYKALDAVMDQLSAFLRALPTADEARAMLPRDVHMLARLFPVLLGVPAVAVTPARQADGVSPSEARRRGVAALRELLGRIADRHRVVIHIDDLQWSDIDSLAVLESILRHEHAPPILFVSTFRDGASDSVAILGRFINDLEDTEPPLDTRLIAVGPILPRDAKSLALRLLGGSTEHHIHLAEEVARESDGSPFFVAELVRHAQRTQTTDADPAESAVSLDDVIRYRLEALPAAARRLLTVLAVAGGTLAAGVAGRVALGDDFSREPIDRLRAEHLIRTGQGTDAPVLEIYHDRIRETALRTVPRPELPHLHLSIARMLASGDSPDAAALSHHFREAGQEQEACEHTIAAANQAVEALAFERAAELYRAALALDSVRKDQRAELEGRFGNALANAGRLFEAGQVLVKAAQTANDERSTAWRREAAEHFLMSGHSEEGRAVLEQALLAVGFSLPGSVATAVASFLKNRALIALRGIRYKVRTESEIDPHLLERLDTLWTASRGLIYTDGLLGADFHARHLRLALRCGEPVRISRALGAEAHLLVSLKPNKGMARAQALLDEAEELAERANSNYGRGMLYQARGHVSLMAGEFASARESLNRAILTFRDHTTGTSAEVGYCLAHSGMCQQYMGQIRDLGPRAHQLLRDSTERANQYVRGFARGQLAFVYLSADQHEEAEEQLSLYQDDAPRRFQAHQLNYVLQRCAYLRYVGRPEDAWETLREHTPEIEKFELMRSPYAKAEMLFGQGQAALGWAAAAKDPTKLVAYARTCAAPLIAMRIAYRRGFGHLLMAGSDVLSDQPDAAAGHLRQALATLQRSQLDGYGFIAKRALSRLVDPDEGTPLAEEATAYFEREGVARPERFARMLAPGLPTT